MDLNLRSWDGRIITKEAHFSFSILHLSFVIGEDRSGAMTNDKCNMENGKSFPLGFVLRRFLISPFDFFSPRLSFARRSRIAINHKTHRDFEWDNPLRQRRKG